MSSQKKPFTKELGGKASPFAKENIPVDLTTSKELEDFTKGNTPEYPTTSKILGVRSKATSKELVDLLNVRFPIKKIGNDSLLALVIKLRITLVIGVNDIYFINPIY